MYFGPPLNCKWSWEKFGTLDHEYETVPLTEKYIPDPDRIMKRCKNCGCYDIRWTTPDEKEEIENLMSIHKRITDQDRMNWLEEQSVTVRIPLVYGSTDCFQACASGRDGDDTSDIRDLIDKEIIKEREKNVTKKKS